MRPLWMARVEILPSTISLAIGPPRMRMLDLAQRPPRLRPPRTPVRFGPAPGSGTATKAARVTPPASGWDSRIEEVIGIGRPRPSMSTSRPFRTLFRRRWVAYAI